MCRFLLLCRGFGYSQNFSKALFRNLLSQHGSDFVLIFWELLAIRSSWNLPAHCGCCQLEWSKFKTFKKSTPLNPFWLFYLFKHKAIFMRLKTRLFQWPSNISRNNLSLSNWNPQRAARRLRRHRGILLGRAAGANRLLPEYSCGDLLVETIDAAA